MQMDRMIKETTRRIGASLGTGPFGSWLRTARDQAGLASWALDLARIVEPKALDLARRIETLVQVSEIKPYFPAEAPGWDVTVPLPVPGVSSLGTRGVLRLSFREAVVGSGDFQMRAELEEGSRTARDYRFMYERYSAPGLDPTRRRLSQEFNVFRYRSEGELSSGHRTPSCSWGPCCLSWSPRTSSPRGMRQSSPRT